MEGRLIIVGTGIQLNHLTLEAKNAMENAKKLLYLVPDAVTESYIKKLNESAENMFRFYEEGKERQQTYNEIIDYIIKVLLEQKDLCVAFYGHPGVFTYPSHKSIILAKELGYEAKMLPGISTEDMIFSELGIDPGNYGLQSFEATSFLLQQYKFDERCYLILWQVGVLGLRKYVQNINIKSELDKLEKMLLKTYPKEHEIILYQGSGLRIIESTIIYTQLQKLHSTKFDPISTMVIRPLI